MSQTKKLTNAQKAALQKLSEGVCDFYDLVRVSANGSTIKALCNYGLVNILYPGNGTKAWQITSLGREALESGLVNLEAQTKLSTNACVAAIQFALETDEGLPFLRCWNEGDFDAIRNEWPEAPEAVFIGADPLHKLT